MTYFGAEDIGVIMTNQTGELVSKLVRLLLQPAFKRAFPHRQHVPAGAYQHVFAAQVTLTVGVNFGLPEIAPGLRECEKMTVVPVPEAAMNKNSCTVLRENNIGRAGKTFDVQTEAESERKKQFAYQ
ncbi:hypothetical protein GCM10008020_39540 [Massilia psychrophila]|nr:hypothetical protein GCM10008020_39540 [Massilia psychrophila]